MYADNQDNRFTDIQQSGSSYFDLKSTLQLFITQKKWECLERSSRNMISAYPESEFGWFALGLALSRLQDYNRAVINLKKAIYLCPNMLAAHYQLGITYYRQNDFNQALYYYNKSFNMGMNSHFLYYNWGNAWLKSGNPNKAIESYLQSLIICPNFVHAAYALFNVYFGKNDYSKAVSVLKPVIADNNLPNYLLAKAKLLYANENDTSLARLRKALKLLNGAIDLDDNFALAYYERAYVKAKLGYVEEFTRDKDMAFQLNPNLKKGHTFSLFASYY